MRQDSIAAAERARQDSIARADSIAAAERAWRLRPIGGFYWGLGAGIAEPTQNVDIAHNTGFNAVMPFGWDPVGSPLGLRFDVGYTTFANRSDYFGAGNSSGRPQLWSGSADLKLHLPVLQRFMHRASLYAVGGATYYHYKNLTLVEQGGGTTVTSPDWSNKLGWNAGGGLQFGWGRTNLFVESRYMTFSHEGLKGGHVPIVLGLSWF
jgi:opacity protein-like surface antigen